MLKTKKIFFIGCVLAQSLFLAGCATTKGTYTDPQDPYESVNRKIFAFNKVVDKVVFRPIAKVYDFVLPWPVKRGVNNFFSNFGEVRNVVNDILQFEFPQAISDTARFVINSTIGIGGLFDVATCMGVEANYEDFGTTLYKWGAKKSPYFVIPFLGPSTIRDAVALPITYEFMTFWPYIDPQELRYGMLGVDLIDRRSKLLPGDKVVDQAFDSYTFVRDAYLQRRSYLSDYVTADTYQGKQLEAGSSVHKQPHKLVQSTIISE
jgi:phospholipid-binding lipoprotein MlaA